MAWIFDEQQVNGVTLAELPVPDFVDNPVPAEAYYNDLVQWATYVRNNGGTGWIGVNMTVTRASDGVLYDEETLFANVDGGSTFQYVLDFVMPAYDVNVTVALHYWDDPTTDPSVGP